jgi:hypothetical protein
MTSLESVLLNMPRAINIHAHLRVACFRLIYNEKRTQTAMFEHVSFVVYLSLGLIFLVFLVFSLISILPTFNYHGYRELSFPGGGGGVWHCGTAINFYFVSSLRLLEAQFYTPMRIHDLILK